MGKSVVVKSGYSFVEAPGKFGPKTYPAGSTIVLTDAEYAALPASVVRALVSTGTPPVVTTAEVAEPVRSDTTVYGSPQQLSAAIRAGTIPVVLKAPDGSLHRLAVANDGTLSTTVYVP